MYNFILSTTFLIFEFFSKIKINKETFEAIGLLMKVGFIVLIESIYFSCKLLNIFFKLLICTIQKLYTAFKKFCELYKRTELSLEVQKNTKTSNFLFRLNWLFKLTIWNCFILKDQKEHRTRKRVETFWKNGLFLTPATHMLQLKQKKN